MIMPDFGKLGFGFLRLPHTDPNDSAVIDLETTIQMVDLFLQRGFRYFDTAYTYLNGKSEEYLRKALVERHLRDSYLIATKLPCGILAKGKTAEGIFEEQRKRCGVDYFDYYLIHNVNEMTHHAVYDFDSFEFVRQKKREGKIKHMGFSFHDKPDALIEALEAFPD